MRHSVNCRILLLFIIWYVRYFASYWIWRENYSTNVKAHFRPNMSNSIRSTCVSPQLEANTRIPARQTPFRLGLSRRQCC